MIIRASFASTGVPINLDAPLGPQIAQFLEKKVGRVGILAPRIYQLTSAIPSPCFNYWLTVKEDGTAEIQYDAIKENAVLLRSPDGSIVGIEKDKADPLPQKGFKHTQEREAVILVNSESGHTFFPIVGRVAPNTLHLFEVILWKDDASVTEEDKEKGQWDRGLR